MVVTATLEDAGDVWPDSVADGVDRTVGDDGDVDGVFADGACTPVSPADPTVVQATCVGGVVTVPTVTAGSGPAGVS